MHPINSQEFTDGYGTSYKPLAKCLLKGIPVTFFAVQHDTSCWIEVRRGAKVLESVPAPFGQSANIYDAMAIKEQIEESGFSRAKKSETPKRRRKQ